MVPEIEETLTRELREVAESVQVPPMPSVAPSAAPAPARPARTRRAWQPLLAAAVVLLVVGLAAVLVGERRSSAPEPAPAPTVVPSVVPSEVPSGTATPHTPRDEIPRTAPTIPYVLGHVLVVDGSPVPGDWSTVTSRAGVWLAQRTDGSWWEAGPGLRPGRIDARIEQPPVLSPDGRYVGYVDQRGGHPTITGFTTRRGGEGLGGAPVRLPRPGAGASVRVTAVTDDGEVIVEGAGVSLMWRPLEPGQPVVDLARTAPDQVVLQGTAAGLVVVDASGGATDAAGTAPYLARISSSGRLTPNGTLPTYDDLSVSPGGAWLVRAPAGTLGGEVAALTQLRTQQVGAARESVLRAPRGEGFASGTWAWEDDHDLIAVAVPVRAPEGAARLVRCDVVVNACRALSAPSGAGSGR
ncbi:MAG: hypothetical protein ACTHNS_01050 [Marmoricola sp.]